MNQRLSGRVTFDYSNNNGKYIIGNDELLFETAWSKASGDSIYIINDPPSIKGVALAIGKHRISDIINASSYDMTSRTRTPQEGEIVILKNRFGNYAALKIIDIKDRTRSDDRDELTFEYVINPNGYTDFSQQKAIVAKWWRRIWPWVKGYGLGSKEYHVGFTFLFSFSQRC